MRAFFILFLLYLTQTLNAQILYQSGLEDWVEGTPIGLMGPHSDLPAELLSEETATVHGGSKAMRITLGLLSEKRITTTEHDVTAGQLYDIRFWVLGRVRIRTGVYDGRPEAGGYSPYNNTVVVNSQTIWQQVIQTVYVTNTSDQAEFIFALEGTSSIAFTVIDDITITRSNLPDPIVATISEIQTTTSPFQYSPLNYQFVRTNGIVTGVASNSYFIQDGSGPWNGIQVFYPPPVGLDIGDSVTVMATVAEFQGFEVPWERTLTQLIVVQQLLIHSADHAGPIPVTLTAIEAAEEQWEGVLVRIQDVECVTLPEPEAFEWHAVNWQGSTVVDDLLYLHEPMLGDYYTITGIAQYDGVRKILPRSAEDFEAGVGIAELGSKTVRVYPNPAVDLVTIEINGPLDGASMNVIDVNGRVVLKETLQTMKHTLDLSEFPNGLYTVSIRQDRSIRSERIVIAH
jgi:hypothetical protein